MIDPKNVPAPIPVAARKKTEKPNLLIIISLMTGPMARPVRPVTPNMPIPSFKRSSGTISAI